MKEKKVEIWGTLGPACADETILIQMLKAGMSGIRLNCSHMSLEQSASWLQLLLAARKAAGLPCELLIDLKGPELRIGALESDLILEEGQVIPIETLKLDEAILPAVSKNVVLELDDGKIMLRALNKTECKVIRGGRLSSHKSVYLPGVNIEKPLLDASDLANLSQASAYGVSAVMQPFVKSGQDVVLLRKQLKKYLPDARIYAKIENLDGLKHAREIACEADCLVIARGDLANAVSLELLPVVQHELETLCQQLKRPYMVVTQMLDSMRSQPVCTRAEANDVFQAVYQGADAIMLTGETASGTYPVQAMQCFCDLAEFASTYAHGGFFPDSL